MKLINGILFCSPVYKTLYIKQSSEFAALHAPEIILQGGHLHYFTYFFFTLLFKISYINQNKIL